ncbi:uncharacterized protein LOC105664732 [Ceratitis capitata]|uniref:uncharacterized protein LOC105664732 n=1 Tax=Ceratitis capitata TaxID=7213 RepID=UPI000618870F|nr:uncharacterized protein LOC105664732 [Ceratitis capitata]
MFLWQFHVVVLRLHLCILAEWLSERLRKHSFDICKDQFSNKTCLVFVKSQAFIKMDRLTITQRVKTANVYFKRGHVSAIIVRLEGYLNRQNCNTCSFENPEIIEDRFQLK